MTVLRRARQCSGSSSLSFSQSSSSHDRLVTSVERVWRISLLLRRRRSVVKLSARHLGKSSSEVKRDMDCREPSSADTPTSEVDEDVLIVDETGDAETLEQSILDSIIVPESWMLWVAVTEMSKMGGCCGSSGMVGLPVSKKPIIRTGEVGDDARSKFMEFRMDRRRVEKGRVSIRDGLLRLLTGTGEPPPPPGSCIPPTLMFTLHLTLRTWA